MRLWYVFYSSELFCSFHMVHNFPWKFNDSSDIRHFAIEKRLTYSKVNVNLISNSLFLNHTGGVLNH